MPNIEDTVQTDMSEHIWDIYFASCCGWILHPGYNREGTVRATIKDAADIADQMLEERNNRWSK
jgi:hypothetical protein